MAEHNDLGTEGEGLALSYLRGKGYIILETNWRYGKNEVDIIAEDGEFIVIVEVKTRSTDYFGRPEFAVDKRKQRLLIWAANAYILRKNLDREARFDIVSVLDGPEGFEISHIEDAFYPIL